MKRLLAILLTLTLMMPLMTQGASAEDAAVYAVVTGGSLRMRASKDKSGEVVATYKENTSVKILENDGTWCHVEVSDGKTGYMLYEFLRLVAGPGHYGWGVVKNRNNSFVNIRSQANSSSAVAAKCPVDTVVEIREKTNGWYKIRYDNIVGYIGTSFVTFLTNAEVENLPDDVRYGKNTYKWDFADENGQVFGTAETLTGAVSGFEYICDYPVTGSDSTNAAMKEAAEAVIGLYAPSIDTDAPTETSSLKISYSTYVTDQRYYAVVFHGAYTKNGAETPVISTFTYDRQSGVALQNDAFFTATADALLILKELYAGMSNSAVTAAVEEADASWLAHAVPTPEGLAVYLAPGEKLAAVYGAQRLVIPYYRLKNTLSLILSDSMFAKPARVIDPTRPMVGLSFDDGPSSATLSILETLEKYDARATFCIVGNRVAEFPKVMEAIAASEHEVATHTWGHADLYKLSQAGIETTLNKSIKAIEDATGKKVSLLRPPYGHVDAKTKSACKRLGLYIVTWTVDSEDWKTRNAARIYNEIMNNVSNGAVILCHDLYDTTAEAMKKVIPALIEQGYQILTLSELYSYHKNGVQAGKLYTHLSPENILTGE